MKKVLFVTLMVCLIIGTGCSMMRQKESRSIVGTWTATHDTGAKIVLVFKPDMSMEFNVLDYSEYSFTAKYTINFSKDPVAIDFIDISSSSVQGSALTGILKFTETGDLELFGEFGSAGQLKRPAEIKKYGELPEIYLLLKKN
ncbi:hypothetical protein ACFL6P_04765 [Candidatus Latescibacterota bacterium]